jgi:hypothetical protein
MMAGTDQGIVYDRNGRMLYHPEFHDRHGQPFTKEELAYLCKFWDIDDCQTLAFALGRTEFTLKTKVRRLRKQQMFDRYKELWDKQFE